MELYEWSLRLFECGIGPGDLMVQTVSNWLFGAAQRVRQTAYRMQANAR
jgi:hypothetical protein